MFPTGTVTVDGRPVPIRVFLIGSPCGETQWCDAPTLADMISDSTDMVASDAVEYVRLDVHNDRVTRLIKANSYEVISRRHAKARLDIAQKALSIIEDLLTDFLLQNLKETEAFEHIPNIDEARTLAQTAIADIANVKREAFGTP